MNSGKYLAIMAFLFISPKVHAVENHVAYANNTTTTRNIKASHTKRKTDDFVYKLTEPGDNYKQRTDEMYQFKEIIHLYSKARDTVEHPIKVQKVDLQRGLVFNFEPTIVTPEQGAMNIDRVKFMMQLSADFL
jgi:hypothetical protein